MAAVLTVLLLVVVGCSTPVEEEGPSGVVVRAEGFRVEAGALTVSAGAGVAPEGTTVEVSLEETVPVGAVPEWVEPVGELVRVMLGDGMQPQAPVEVRLAVDEPLPESGDVALLTVSQDGSVDVVEARVDEETGELVAVVDHLSWLRFFRLGERFVDGVLTLAGHTLDISYPDPECETSVEIAGVARYEVFAPGQAYMCLSASGDGGVVLEVHSAINMPYTVRPEPHVDAQNLPGSAAGLLGTAVMYRVPNDGVTPGVLAGGSTVRFIFPPGVDPESVTFMLRPELLFMDLITASLDRLHGGLANLVGATECWANMASTSLRASSMQPTSTATSAISNALGCAGSSIGGVASVVLGLVLPLVQTLISTVLTNVEAVAQRDVIRAEIDRTDLAPAPPPVATGPDSFVAMDGRVYCQTTVHPTEHPDRSLLDTEFLDCVLGGYEPLDPSDPDCAGPLTVTKFDNYLSYTCGDTFDRTGAVELGSGEVQLGAYACRVGMIAVVCESAEDAVEVGVNDYQHFTYLRDGSVQTTVLGDIQPLG